MALQCRVVLNENNEIDYVETEDGQRSQLFDGLAETLGGDKNSALGFYALTESEDFKTIQKNERLSQTKKQELETFAKDNDYWNAGNFKGYLASDSLEVLKEFKNNVGDLTSEFTDETSLTKPRPLVEPSVEEVVQYANATEEELTPEQTIDLQDVIMSLGVNNSKEAEKKLKEALETKGFIRFNKKQMLNSGAFNKYEVKQILNSKEKQDQVEQSYRALKNSPTIEVEYPKDFVYNTSEINSFGKQKALNPFILQQDIIKQGKIPEGVLIEQQTQQKEVRVQTKAREIIKVEVTPKQTITEQQDFKELTKIELPSPKFLTVSQLSKAVNSEKMIELKNKQEELKKRWKELDEISNCIWKS